jgi:hypothetical protein
MMNQSIDIPRFHDVTTAAGRRAAQRHRTQRSVPEIEREAVG